MSLGRWTGWDEGGEDAVLSTRARPGGPVICSSLLHSDARSDTDCLRPENAKQSARVSQPQNTNDPQHRTDGICAEMVYQSVSLRCAKWVVQENWKNCIFGKSVFVDSNVS